MKPAASPAEQRQLECAYLRLSYRAAAVVAQTLEQRAVASQLIGLDREVGHYLAQHPDESEQRHLAQAVEPVLQTLADRQRQAPQPAQLRHEFRQLYLDLEGLGGLLGYPRR